MSSVESRVALAGLEPLKYGITPPELITATSSPTYLSSSRFIILYSSLPFLACPCKSIEVNEEWKINQPFSLLVVSFLIKLVRKCKCYFVLLCLSLHQLLTCQELTARRFNSELYALS